MYHRYRKNHNPRHIRRGGEFMSICKNSLISIGWMAVTGVLSGCSLSSKVLNQDEYWAFNVMTNEVRAIRTPKVRFIAIENIHEFCSNIVGNIGGRQVYFACSQWSVSSGRCEVYTPKDAHPMIIGHEVRHCFEAAFH